MDDPSEPDPWWKIFVAEISRQGFGLSDGAILEFYTKIENLLDNRLISTHITDDTKIAITAVADDAISHATLESRKTISREDIRHAFERCRYYPFC